MKKRDSMPSHKEGGFRSNNKKKKVTLSLSFSTSVVAMKAEAFHSKSLRFHLESRSVSREEVPIINMCKFSVIAN